MTQNLKIGVILSSTRKGRVGEVVRDWFLTHAQGRAGMEFGVLDLRDYPLPFFDESAPPAAKTPDHDVAVAWEEAIAGFDGFIVLTAEYNHGMTGVLKNAFDYGFKGWQRKPLGTVGYGGVGGARAVEQLRLVAVNFGMVPVAGGVNIAGADFIALSKDRDPKALGDHLDKALSGLLDDMEFWGHAVKAAKAG